ncbi:putative bifunctional diguanylate cyclase/phosphodiesterase [Aromatoleum diolicum]|uniref:EAL domain-containing protein n=1 Tax=Aromatoleum diolicum TaxID=75796 RepID=A0ABX1QF46_9RHOO|nr:EAL domain-containing protein [Aromatoleum diolicum]NMG75685.1 EAL domain-containing protein [Aromatoleum diolicum]
MKLRTQIFSGYALLALLVLVVGATGYLALRAVSRDFDTAINRIQPILTALQTVRADATSLAFSAAVAAQPRNREERAATASTSTGQSAEAPAAPAHAAPPSIADLMASVDAYRTLVAKSFPNELDEARVIEAHAHAFAHSIEMLRIDGTTLSDKAVHAQLARIKAALDTLLAAVAEATAGEQREFHEQQESAESQSMHYLYAIVAVCLVSLLAAIGGGGLLASHISRPIRALRHAALRLGSGRLDTRVAITSSNEIGLLAHTFNHMADDLAHSLVSREYVESIIESLAEGVVVLDEAGRIERCNPAMRRLYDESVLGALEGRALREVFVTDSDVEGLMGDPTARQGFECRLAGRHEPPTVVAVSVSPIMLGASNKGRVLLVQDVTERKRHEERLSYLASYDVLTGLPNRRMFLDHLRSSLVRLPWNKQHIGLLFCDLDRFKFVNDSLGHSIGDMLLQRITERIRDVLRPGDIVGRWAGDEFVVLLDEIARPDDIDLVAAKIVESLRQPVQIGPHELYVTASVGTACAPGDGLDADELVKNADLAMYAAKAAGKNHFMRYAPEMRTRTELRLLLEHALRSALDAEDQLQVHYQAQQNLDGSLIGFEALVRWQHPQLGLISPAQFLPAAEEAGLMAALDESVLRMACAELRRWRESGWPQLRVAVNLSNQSFRREDLVDMAARAIAEAGVPPSSVELELTEDIVMENVGSAVNTMDRLCALGIHLSIDDFGTGYSSLSQLKRCPIELLKIDRSFITDVIHDESDHAITNAIIALAHKLGIKVLAEGVETQAQFDLLRQSGCDAIQGYLLSKPLPADALPAWLAARPR